MILNLVDDDMIWRAVIEFSTVVHHRSPLFRCFWESKLAIFVRFCKMCAFCVHTKQWHIIFFCKCDVVFIFFPSIDYHHPITHLGWWRGHGTKVFNFSKLTTFFTHKNSVIIVDCKLWWFSLLVGVASMMIIWKMFNFLSLMRLPDYFLILFDLHTSGTK